MDHPDESLAAPETKDQPNSSRARASDSWDLVWSDEFSSFDNSKWTVIDAPSGINNDLAYLTPNNVWIQNGNLHIRANNNSIGGRNFTGGKVMSKGKFEFKYGRVDVRLRTASTPGTHTAAWLIHNFCDGVNPCVGGWPPEIDIVEMIGREPNKVHQTVHYGTTPYDGTTGGRYPDWGFSPTDITLSGNQAPGVAFHVYSVEWEPNEIRWYIDGNLTKTWQANNTNSFIPKETMYIILDVVVGGDWAQAPTSASVWPQYVDFDYVRVYQNSNSNQPTPSQSGTYRIKNAASGYYLTADGATQEWKTPFQASLNNSWGTQKWKKTDLGGGWFTLAPEWSQNRVLTADNTAGSKPTYQAAYQGWNTQKWKSVDVGGEKVRLEPQWPQNTTLTTTGDGNWSTIGQRAPTGSEQEHWFLEEVEE